MGNVSTKVRKKNVLRKKPSNTSEKSYQSFSSKSLKETQFQLDDGTTTNFSASEIYMTHNFVASSVWGNAFSAPLEDILATKGKVLEVGCGFGSWLIEMANSYPKSEFTGVELNPYSPCTFPPNVKIIKGDLFQLPFEDDEFDFTRIAGFACEITDTEWEQGILEITRVTKRGGWIEISESDMFPQKKTPTVKMIIDKFIEALELQGLNGKICAKLDYILYNIDQLTEIRSASKPVLIGPRGGPTGITLMVNLDMWFREVCSSMMIEHMGVTQKNYMELWQICEGEIERNDTEINLYRWWAQKRLG